MSATNSGEVSTPGHLDHHGAGAARELSGRKTAEERGIELRPVLLAPDADDDQPLEGQARRRRDGER
jgi:hypothetical protein